MSIGLHGNWFVDGRPASVLDAMRARAYQRVTAQFGGFEVRICSPCAEVPDWHGLVTLDGNGGAIQIEGGRALADAVRAVDEEMRGAIEEMVDANWSAIQESIIDDYEEVHACNAAAMDRW